MFLFCFVLCFCFCFLFCIGFVLLVVFFLFVCFFFDFFVLFSFTVSCHSCCIIITVKSSIIFINESFQKPLPELSNSALIYPLPLFFVYYFFCLRMLRKCLFCGLIFSAIAIRKSLHHKHDFALLPCVSYNNSLV